MSKILVKELRETLKQNQRENIKVVDYNGLSLEIRQFLTISEKLTLIKSIFESAIDRNNGLHILNRNSLDIAYKVLLVQTYTNLTLPKDIIESYDLLMSSGLYDFIYSNILEVERLQLNKALDNHIDAERDEYEQKNTLNIIIRDFLNNFNNGLTELINKIPDEEQMGKMTKEIPQLLSGLFGQIKEGTKQLNKEEKEYLNQLASNVIGNMKNRVGSI